MNSKGLLTKRQQEIRRAFAWQGCILEYARRISYCRFVNKPLLSITTNQRSPKVVDLAAQKMYWRSTRPFFSPPPHNKKKSGLGTRLNQQLVFTSISACNIIIQNDPQKINYVKPYNAHLSLWPTCLISYFRVVENSACEPCSLHLKGSYESLML